MMLHGWQTYKLGEVATFRNGKSRGITNGDIPIYGGNGILGFSDATNTSGESVIIGRVGAYCGSVFYENRPIWISDNAIYAKPINDYSTRFLYYVLKNSNLNKRAIGSSQPLLTQTLLNQIEVLFITNKEEQEKIVTILSSLDDKIELNLEMNKTLEATAYSIFKEWFIDFRFPGFDEILVDGLPKRWKHCRLSDFGIIVCGKTPSKANKDFFNGPIMFVKIPDMHNNVFVIETGDSLTEEGLNSQPKKTIPPFSICVSSIATVGLVCINSELCQTNQQINSIIPTDPITRYYLYFAARSMKEIFLATASGGTATLNMNTSQFSCLENILPEGDILTKFNEIVTPIMLRILANLYENKSLIQIRNTILPKLMSGKIRVE